MLVASGFASLGFTRAARPMSVNGKLAPRKAATGVPDTPVAQDFTSHSVLQQDFTSHSVQQPRPRPHQVLQGPMTQLPVSGPLPMPVKPVAVPVVVKPVPVPVAVRVNGLPQPFRSYPLGVMEKARGSVSPPPPPQGVMVMQQVAMASRSPPPSLGRRPSLPQTELQQQTQNGIAAIAAAGRARSPQKQLPTPSVPLQSKQPPQYQQPQLSQSPPPPVVPARSPTFGLVASHPLSPSNPSTSNSTQSQQFSQPTSQHKLPPANALRQKAGPSIVQSVVNAARQMAPGARSSAPPTQVAVAQSAPPAVNSKTSTLPQQPKQLQQSQQQHQQQHSHANTTPLVVEHKVRASRESVRPAGRRALRSLFVHHPTPRNGTTSGKNSVEAVEFATKGEQMNEIHECEAQYLGKLRVTCELDASDRDQLLTIIEPALISGEPAGLAWVKKDCIVGVSRDRISIAHRDPPEEPIEYVPLEAIESIAGLAVGASENGPAFDGELLVIKHHSPSTSASGGDAAPRVFLTALQTASRERSEELSRVIRHFFELSTNEATSTKTSINTTTISNVSCSLDHTPRAKTGDSSKNDVLDVLDALQRTQRRSVSGELVKSAPNSPRKTNTTGATSMSPSPSLSRIDVSHSPSPSPPRHYYSRERSMTNWSTAVPMSPVSYTPVERRRDRKRSPSHGGLTLKSRASVGTIFSAYSAVSADLMQAYLRTLAEKLTPNELSQFNHLLLEVDFNEREDFEEFCQQVWRLYGPEGAELMLGLRNFVPEAQREFFENFLASRGLSSRPTPRQSQAPPVNGAANGSHKVLNGAPNGAGTERTESPNGLVRDWRASSERGTGGTLPLSDANTLAWSELSAIHEIDRAIRPYEAEIHLGARAATATNIANHSRHPSHLFARSISTLFDQSQQ